MTLPLPPFPMTSVSYPDTSALSTRGYTEQPSGFVHRRRRVLADTLNTATSVPYELPAAPYIYYDIRVM